jgi:hypothetical protein
LKQEKHVWGDDYPQTLEGEKMIKAEWNLSKNTEEEFVAEIKERSHRTHSSKTRKRNSGNKI